MLPTYSEIEQWTDEKLMSVIDAGDKINWDIGFGENPDEVECYINNLYVIANSRF